MKRKGFTLIELLAVIVILAIIALIATPIILGIIRDAKEESEKRSVELYANAIKNAIVTHQMKNSGSISGSFTTTDGKTLTQGSTNLKVEYDGNVVCKIIYIYKDGNINMEDCKITGGDKNYNYSTQQFTNGKVVYYDVTKGEGCTNYHEDNSITGYNGIYEGSNSKQTTDNQNGCLKFYAFKYDGGETINLILDHDTTGAVAWNSNISDYKGPKEVIEQLKIDTSEWKGTLAQNNYTLYVENEGQLKEQYTVNYNEYKARLITANEIAQIVGHTKWNEVNDGYTYSSYYYFHNLSTLGSSGTVEVCAGTSDGCKYGWLYDRTRDNCEKYGCLNNSVGETKGGYWTSTMDIFTGRQTWIIFYTGKISTENKDSVMGLRPVITILKSQL